MSKNESELMTSTFASVQTSAGIAAGVAPESPAASSGQSAITPCGLRLKSFFWSSNDASLMSKRSLSAMRRAIDAADISSMPRGHAALALLAETL
eukprot:4786088-Prymnesium_polylepis.2